MAAPTTRTAKRSIELFYDVMSPYSWIGFEILLRYRKEWDVNVQLRPFAIGGVFKLTGNHAPGVVPAKFKYMMTDLKRVADYCGVPIRPPSDPQTTMFKKGSMSAQRLLVAAQRSHPEYVEPLSRALWQRVWSNDQDITEMTSLKEACEAVDIDSATADSLVAAITEQEIKDTLKNVTAEAASRGAFGAPTFFVGEDMYFGCDRFDIMARSFGKMYYGPFPNRYVKEIQEVLDGTGKL